MSYECVDRGRLNNVTEEEIYRLTCTVPKKIKHATFVETEWVFDGVSISSNGKGLILTDGDAVWFKRTFGSRYELCNPYQ